MVVTLLSFSHYKAGHSQFEVRLSLGTRAESKLDLRIYYACSHANSFTFLHSSYILNEMEVQTLRSKLSSAPLSLLRHQEGCDTYWCGLE
jgi:hypothetical protein